MAGAIRKTRAARDRESLKTALFITISFLSMKLVYDTKQLVPEKRVPVGG